MLNYLAVLRELIAAGELKGPLHGRLENATFIPDVYIVMQKKWVDSFFTSNNYLGRNKIGVGLLELTFVV